VELEAMTMEIELAKRDFVKQLWEETRYDETARDLIFGEVIEDMETHAEEVADEREDAIRDEVRDEVKGDLIEDPPDDLIAGVIKSLIEYPPNGDNQEAYSPWLELRGQITSEIRGEAENELGDLELKIEGLKEEIARLKGEKYETPEVRKAKRGKVRR
jgi:hypothetical protein